MNDCSDLDLSLHVFHSRPISTRAMTAARHALIGSPEGNFWIHHSDHGFDLTHPPSPDAPPVLPRLPLQTTTSQIAIDPAKSALVVIDMQNFFLSENIGRPADGKGLQAAWKLAEDAIPAARRAGIQIIWLNWGLTHEEVKNMPPATLRAFGFSSVPADDPLDGAAGRQTVIDDHGINGGSPEIAKKYETHVSEEELLFLCGSQS